MFEIRSGTVSLTCQRLGGPTFKDVHPLLPKERSGQEAAAEEFSLISTVPLRTEPLQ